MKIFVKTLKGTHFEIEVNPEDTVVNVKKSIETNQGQNVYPAEQQMLIHQGKILKDATTLAENSVSDGSFVVIMLSKAKPSTSGASSTTASAPSTQPPPAISASPAPATSAAPSQTSAVAIPPVTTATQTVPAVQASAEAEQASAEAAAPAPTEIDTYSQAASNLVAGSNFEEAIQHILDIGGGTWDRDTVVRALRAAFNNPERAIEYLYSGIPEQQEAPRVAQVPPSQAPPQPAQAAIPSGGPNANPLDLFPQGLPSLGSNVGGSNLDFLRNSPQFRALQAMVQANPHILQPMLQELGKQNPQLMRLIQEHQADFVRLLNEPAEGAEGNNILGQLGSAMPQAIQVTPEEREAIERLEAMGFDRALVLEVYFACNKNEELAANYLLDHINDFED